MTENKTLEKVRIRNLITKSKAKVDARKTQRILHLNHELIKEGKKFTPKANADEPGVSTIDTLFNEIVDLQHKHKERIEQNKNNVLEAKIQRSKAIDKKKVHNRSFFKKSKKGQPKMNIQLLNIYNDVKDLIDKEKQQLNNGN